MTKIEFANIPNGTLLDSETCRYRLVERIARKLVLAKVGQVASAPNALVVTEPEREEWEIVREGAGNAH